MKPKWRHALVRLKSPPSAPTRSSRSSCPFRAGEDGPPSAGSGASAEAVALSSAAPEALAAQSVQQLPIHAVRHQVWLRRLASPRHAATSSARCERGVQQRTLVARASTTPRRQLRSAPTGAQIRCPPWRRGRRSAAIVCVARAPADVRARSGPSALGQALWACGRRERIWRRCAWRSRLLLSRGLELVLRNNPHRRWTRTTAVMRTLIEPRLPSAETCVAQTTTKTPVRASAPLPTLHDLHAPIVANRTNHNQATPLTDSGSCPV